MAWYRIVGKADSLQFALAEKIGFTLENALPDRHIEMEMVDPDQWEAELNQLQNSYGFRVPNHTEVVVINHGTGRFVGDLLQFQREVDVKYGLSLQLSDSELAVMANQNYRLFIERRQST
eukprot:TRINITY_DN11111_c0_g1_i1.p1 TRINITY_DN11111_c0_g1~~TRINITY_DN11111_c0_g1_i1.p1  ORF type:complete len:120 (-),score=7.66 TRINITY_DN11111_c0_g1_i1:213-572(-)